MRITFKNRLSAALVLLFIMAPLYVAVFVGCANKLQGDQMQNIPPEVGFINSPPESTSFSRNAVIYWWGTDEDGIISYFRFHVATVAQLGGLTPDQYIAGIGTDEWTIVEADIVGGDPGTDRIIKMSADLKDPVNTFVLQYVFLQAFDEEGASSPIIHRIYGRNDNPPNTVIFNPVDQPFVNSIEPGGVITGVKMGWAGTDPIDYPSDPPPFDFHYKLYGPFDSVTFESIQNNFFTERYLTADGRVYRIGQTVVFCDDTAGVSCAQANKPVWATCSITRIDTIRDSVGTIMEIDTNMQCTGTVTSSVPTDAFGGLQDHFACDTATFPYDTLFQQMYPDSLYKVYESNNPFDPSSFWVQKTADTIFNVFRNFPLTGAADTTIEQSFIFWCRSRDDALVPDLIPSFRSVRVIDPRYERGVLVIDMASILTTVRAWVNRWSNIQTAKGYWYNTIKSWADAVGDTSLYLDTNKIGGGIYAHAQDYYIGARTQNIVPISWLLKHKVIIVYNESINKPNFQTNGLGGTIFKAIDAGVNVWVNARSIGGNGKTQPYTASPPLNPDYTRYFGVLATVFSGWGCHAASNVTSGNCPFSRIEDFIGATAYQSGWPDISVDTALLHSRIGWSQPFDDQSNYPAFAWIDSCPVPPGNCATPTNYGLPEVGWSVRSFGTELLYLYVSYYGNNHPRGRGPDYDFIFNGAPVCHRFNAGLFKTVHSSFTPMVLDSVSGQVMIDSIMNFLYDPNLGASPAPPVAKGRYEDGKLQLSVEDAKANVRRREAELESIGFLELEKQAIENQRLNDF